MPFRFPSTFLAALCALGAPAQAQLAVSLTGGGGLNSSSTDADGGGAAYSNRLGYNLGAGLQLRPVPNFSYAFEANLETRGEDAEVDVDPFQGKYSLKLLYVQVPVYLMFHVPAGRATVDLFGGPVLGIPLSGSIESDILFAPRGEIENLWVQLGAEGGVGLEVPAGSVAVFLRSSYYHGFTPVSRDMEDRQRNIKLKAGVRVPL